MLGLLSKLVRSCRAIHVHNVQFVNAPASALSPAHSSPDRVAIRAPFATKNKTRNHPANAQIMRPKSRTPKVKSFTEHLLSSQIFTAQAPVYILLKKH
jgi:hypothetical protein